MLCTCELNNNDGNMKKRDETADDGEGCIALSAALCQVLKHSAAPELFKINFLEICKKQQILKND